MIKDAENNIEKMLKLTDRFHRLSGCAKVLDMLGVEDPILQYSNKKMESMAKVGSLAQVDDHQIATYLQDKAIIYDICKENGILPYALVRN